VMGLFIGTNEKQHSGRSYLNRTTSHHWQAVRLRPPRHQLQNLVARQDVAMDPEPCDYFSGVAVSAGKKVFGFSW